MEAQTYLTQVHMDNQKQINLCQQKFTRFNLTQGKKSQAESSQIKKIRHGNHHFNKNITEFLSDNYYSVKKVKPGISFYKTILQAEQRRKVQQNIPLLKINMPQTLLFLQHSLQLIYTQNGVVKVKSQSNFNEFIKIVKTSQNKQDHLQAFTSTNMSLQTLQSKSSKKTVDVYPAVLFGVGNGIYTDFTLYMSNQLDSRVLPRNENQLSVLYKSPYSKIPNILRLFYTPQNMKNSRPSYAYKAINKCKINQQILQRKYKQLHNYVVDFNKNQLILVNQVKGKALGQVQSMTQSIIEYLQAIKKVKITEIIIDFVFASDKKYYLQQIRSIKSINLSNIWDIGTKQQIQQVKKQQSNLVQCKLCQFMFPKIQITRLVTNKLIVQFLAHLKQRGQAIFEFNNSTLFTLKNCSNLSGLSHVCQICYQIIVAQHHLIDVQQQFCKIGHIGIDKVIRVNSPTDQIFNLIQFEAPNKNCSNIDDLYKWRLFFYIQRIKNVPLQEIQEEQKFSLTMKFNQQKCLFTKCYKKPDLLFGVSRAQSAYSTTKFNKNLDTKRNQHLNLSATTAHTGAASRHDKKSTLHTNYTNRSNLTFLKQKSESLVSFQKLKILPFFTDSQDIYEILNNQEIIFELSYANKKYKGHSSTLKNFSNKKDCQRHGCQVLLFDNQYQYCNLELDIGIICDGRVSRIHQNTTMSQNGRIYFDKGHTSKNCCPLPAQWIQTISQGLAFEQQQSPKQFKQKDINRGGFSRAQSATSLTTTKSTRTRIIKNYLNIKQQLQQEQQQSQQYL